MIFLIELDEEEGKALKAALKKNYGDKDLGELIRLAVLDANHFLNNTRMIRDQFRFLADRENPIRKTRESKLRR